MNYVSENSEYHLHLSRETNKLILNLNENKKDPIFVRI